MDVISALLSQSPFLGMMIIGLCMVLISSSGKFFSWGAIDEQAKRLLWYLGWIVFSVGAIPASILVVSTTWDNISPSRQTYLINLWNSIQYLFSWFLLFFGVAGLFAVWITRLRKQQIEKGLELKIIPVGKRGKYPDYYHKAYIQVENIGKGKITCAARLVKVTRINLNDIEHQDIDVNWLNPDGLYLGWGERGAWFEKINESGPPIIVHLVSGYFRRSASDKVVFLFAGYQESPSINYGQYIIQVQFLRWKDGRYLKFASFEETLKVSSSGFEWMK